MRCLGRCVGVGVCTCLFIAFHRGLHVNARFEVSKQLRKDFHEPTLPPFRLYLFLACQYMTFVYTDQPAFARGKRFDRCSSICASCASFELRLFSPFLPFLTLFICLPDISEHPLKLGSASSASNSTTLVLINPGYRPVSWRQRSNLHSDPSINNSPWPCRSVW